VAVKVDKQNLYCQGLVPTGNRDQGAERIGCCSLSNERLDQVKFRTKSVGKRHNLSSAAHIIVTPLQTAVGTPCKAREIKELSFGLNLADKPSGKDYGLTK